MILVDMLRSPIATIVRRPFRSSRTNSTVRLSDPLFEVGHTRRRQAAEDIAIHPVMIVGFQRRHALGPGSRRLAENARPSVGSALQIDVDGCELPQRVERVANA